MPSPRMAACKLRATQHAPDQCAWVVNAGRLRAQHARGSVTSNGLAWLGFAFEGDGQRPQPLPQLPQKQLERRG